MSLDWNYLSRNKEEGAGTDVLGLQPEVVDKMNGIAKGYYDLTGDTLMITGGSEVGYHSKSSNGTGHEDGWKVDIATTTTNGNTVNQGVLAQLLDTYNVMGGAEDEYHYDLQFNSAGGYGGYLINNATGGDYGTRSSVSQSEPEIELPEEFQGNPYFGDVGASVYTPQENFINEADWSGVENLKDDDASFADKFFDSWFNNGTIATMRNAIALYGSDDYTGYASTYTPTDDEVKYVQEVFKDTPDVAQSILNNAQTHDHFYELLRMRQEDRDRAERVEKSSYGVSTLGTIAGTLLDPINFIPFVGEGVLGVKLASSLGLKTLTSLGAGRVRQMASVALQNGALNVADSALNHGATGARFNPAEAFILGAGASAGIDFLRGSLVKNLGKNGQSFLEEQEALSERSLMSATGNRLDPNNLLPTEVLNTTTLGMNLEPKDYARQLLNSYKSPEYEEAFAKYQEVFPERSRKNFNQTLKTMEKSNKTLAESISGYKIINGIPSSPSSMITHLAEKAPEFTDFSVSKALDEKAPIFERGKVEDNPEAIRKLTQGDLPSWLQKTGQMIDTFGFTGDRFGNLINSPAKSVRDFSQMFLVDPRQRALSKRNPVELYKKVAKNEFDTHIGKVLDAYSRYGLNNHKLWGSEALYKDFADNVWEAHNLKYRLGESIEGFPKEIQDAVEELMRFRRVENKTLKQAGVIPHENVDDTKELWRRVDARKRNYFRTLFNSDEELHNTLADYFENFVNRETLDADTPIREQALNWAKYVMNDDESILGEFGDKFMNYYKSRIDLDTSGLMQLPNGDIFSFDDMLRDKDIINTMRYVANRSAGAIGLRLGAGIDNIGGELRDMYKTMEGELEDYVQRGLITRKKALEQLEDVRETMHKVSGAIIHEQDMKAQGALDKITNILLTNSYAQNGMNMGTAQIGEAVGSVSVAGAKALTHYIPKLHDYLHDLIDGNIVSSKQLRNFLDMKVGYDLAEHIMFNPEIRGVEELAMEKASIGLKALGYLEKGVNQTAKITSKLNMLTHLTSLSRSGVKGDVMADMLKWARGDFKSWLRDDLFSERSFAEVGITDIPKFKESLNKYIGNLGKEDNALVEALDKWKEDDINGYYKMLSFLDVTANKAILEPNLGNASKATSSNVAKLLFQFKNFTRMAMNGHFMRALSNPQKSQVVTALSTAFAGGLIWAVRTAIMADATMTESKRKQYLKKTLTPENLLRAGFFRGSVTGALSPINDLYEGLTGASTIRTTVNRSKSSGDAISDMIAQTPALASLGRTLDGFKSIGELAFNLDSKGDSNKKRQKNIERLFPIDRYIVIQGVLALLNDQIDQELEQETFLNSFRNNKGEH